MRWIAVLILAFATAPSLALAQDDDTKTQAKAAFMKGREAFTAGNFKDALDSFEKANSLRPHPLMIYNIAQVYETMGDLPGAIGAYKEYLASKPDDAAEVKKKVDGFSATLATWPRVALTSTPPGATVWIEAFKARPRGQTPLTMQVPNTSTLILGAPGYERATKVLNLPASSEHTFEIAMVKILPVVRITSEPAGAVVRFDDQPPLAGGTPVEHRLDTGVHTVTVELKGFEPFTQQFTLASTHTRENPLAVAANLTISRPKGDLIIKVDTDAVSILVDGQPVGMSPLPGPLTLEEGVHKVRVESVGGEPYEEMVAVKANQTVTTEIDVSGGTFELNQRFVSYLLMGTGGAALIGGGVVALMASGTKDDFDKCDADVGCARTQKQVDLADDVRSQALTADILLGAGVAIAATGVVLFLLDDDEQAPQVGLVPTDGGMAAFGTVHF